MRIVITLYVTDKLFSNDLQIIYLSYLKKSISTSCQIKQLN